MQMTVRKAGAHKTASPKVKHGGVWKDADGFVKKNGVWKQFHSNVTFNPAPGNLSGTGTNSASVTITASKAVVWTYTKDATVSCNLTSGTSSTSITFTISGASNFGTAAVQAAGSSWNVSLSTA